MFTQLEDKSNADGRWYENELKQSFPKEDVDRIFSQDGVDKDYDFKGFAMLYKWAGGAIPESMTVINIGCYLAPQCYYFRNHAKYIGVDSSDLERFKMENTEHYTGSIIAFVNDYGFKDMPKEERAKYYVICSREFSDTERWMMDELFGENHMTFYPSW